MSDEEKPSEKTPLLSSGSSNKSKGKDEESGGGGSGSGPTGPTGPAGGSTNGKVSSTRTVGSVFRRFIQPSMAELFGVTLVVFSAVAAVTAGNVLAEGIVYGLMMAAAMASVGSISGGHINPAVTLGVLIAGGINPLLGLCYFCVQIIGGILGAACCRGMMSYDVGSINVASPNGTVINTDVIMYESVGGGVHHLGEGVTLGCGVFCEIMLTMVVVMPYLMLSVDSRGRNPAAPLLIGFAYIVCIVAGGAISGASMNPARSFGPAVIMSDLDSTVWQDHWVYWVGPALGAMLSGWLYRFLFAASDKRVIFKED